MINILGMWATDHYFMAHKILPHRAEPLVKLAEYYWPDASAPRNSALCYLFAKRAYELSYPERGVYYLLILKFTTLGVMSY